MKLVIVKIGNICIPTEFLLLRAFKTVSKRENAAVSVDVFSLKPCCSLENIFCWSKKSYNLLCNIFSTTLENDINREIGL